MLSTGRRPCSAVMVLCVVAHAAAFQHQQVHHFPQQQQMQQLMSPANPLPTQQNQFQKSNQIPQTQQLPQQQQQQFPQQQQQLPQGMAQFPQGMAQQQFPQGMAQFPQGMAQQQFPQGMTQFPQGMAQQQFPQGMAQQFPQGMPQQPFQQQGFPQAQFGQQFQQFNSTMMQTPVVAPKPAVPKRIAYIPPCQYLSSRPTPRGANTGPFELETYSGGKTRIERGWPVQVTIKLWENSAYGFEKFSDFIIYAVTSTPAAAEGGAAEPYKPVGVFWMDPAYSRWWSGAKGFKCNRGSQGYDAVGSIESYTHDLYKAMFPGDANLNSYKPRTRNIGKYLWLPSESAMGATGITFHAKINIRGEWFKLTSPTWPVYNPPSPEEIRRRQFEQIINIRRQMAEFERRANAAEAAAQAPP